MNITIDHISSDYFKLNLNDKTFKIQISEEFVIWVEKVDEDVVYLKARNQLGALCQEPIFAKKEFNVTSSEFISEFESQNDNAWSFANKNDDSSAVQLNVFGKRIEVYPFARVLYIGFYDDEKKESIIQMDQSRLHIITRIEPFLEKGETVQTFKYSVLNKLYSTLYDKLIDLGLKEAAFIPEEVK